MTQCVIHQNRSLRSASVLIQESFEHQVIGLGSPLLMKLHIFDGLYRFEATHEAQLLQNLQCIGFWGIGEYDFFTRQAIQDLPQPFFTSNHARQILQVFATDLIKEVCFMQKMVWSLKKVIG